MPQIRYMQTLLTCQDSLPCH